MFADFLFLDRPLSFNQHYVTQCRDRIALSIFKWSSDGMIKRIHLLKKNHRVSKLLLEN